MDFTPIEHELRDGTRVEYEPVSDLLYALTGIEAESAVPGGGRPAWLTVLKKRENYRAAFDRFDAEKLQTAMQI